MPAFAGALSDEEIWAVLAYIKWSVVGILHAKRTSVQAAVDTVEATRWRTYR